LLTGSTVLAQALPVQADAELTVSSFDVGLDVHSVQAQYRPQANGKTRFANSGVMLGGKVWTADVKPAAIRDFTAFTGSRTALTLGDVVAHTQFVPPEFYLSDASLANWAQLKGAKSKKRISANGHAYTYSEGAVTYPDRLTRASRTVITGEGGSAPSRTKHVVATAQGRLRRLTPEELEELNGFEPGFTKLDGVSDMRRSFFMGNALVVGIVTAIGRALTARIGQFSESGAPVTAQQEEVQV
jgi:DNA (cytosine-5)-methyltransferase 1